MDGWSHRNHVTTVTIVWLLHILYWNMFDDKISRYISHGGQANAEVSSILSIRSEEWHYGLLFKRVNRVFKLEVLARIDSVVLDVGVAFVFPSLTWQYSLAWQTLPVAEQARITPIFNSSPPSAAYMRQRIRSALVQIMACRLFGAKPLPEPVLAYCVLHPWEQISVKS